MSDQKLHGQSHGTPGSTSDVPPAKRPCMNDTPPIAGTPDDGSDFYNTPWTAGTPVNNNEDKNVVATSQPSEPSASPNPAPIIPGLNLVNESFKDMQPANNESNPPQNPENENIVADTNVDDQTETTQNKPETTAQQEPVPVAGEAMEVEQNGEQHNQEVANQRSNETGAAPAPDAMDTTLPENEDEHPEWEVDSSPYESSSDSSTDSSDDSDDSDDEDYPILSAEEQARILMQAELGSDDEGEGKGKSGGHIKTANEIVDDVPPIPDITVTPEMKTVFLGSITAIVENTILIEASVSGEYQVLESGSLLCLENRNVIGVVSETLGRVENPLYAVRFPSAADVEQHGLSKGTNIYYVEQHSTFVFTQPLKGIKGSDASNFHDEEIAEDEVEFSDDEAEAEYKRKLKQKRQERKDARNENGPARAKKGQPGPSKLSHTELNYDDDAGEDGYTPLARPKNLHEIMGQQEAPVEGDGPSARGSGFRGGRGRGRGDRGRGGRGRGGSRDFRDQNSRDSRPQAHQPRPATDSQPQPASYGQQAYQPAQQGAYGLPQQFPFAPFQQQQQPYAQSATPPQFPFQMPQMPQMPYQQQFQQTNPYINPLFLAALQQQQQQYQQPQQAAGQPQGQNPSMNFDQVKAQLDLLRQLSNQNQGPPPQ
ncbi:hypothetical protein ASPWEDRAFT_27769 [Aspergillus wentii DTO 134E9]|uniref:H/ACA ribonucleoprotein complex non-core subunit NAF1 n=1 Tax=Aspergillus wentii DTO 134E9 TaxID=1073089 RepID=A0A1L9RJS4_ASPWE|nr:uncharacterized protein ASPWEDRAFT_27769 [Aspergillus wentii DTO 134E9]OJJ35097.1 hypothetical protein ASPWEDRAFT_27769 [Aspergillus wentii DTO 134E9]